MKIVATCGACGHRRRLIPRNPGRVKLNSPRCDRCGSTMMLSINANSKPGCGPDHSPTPEPMPMPWPVAETSPWSPPSPDDPSLQPCPRTGHDHWFILQDPDATQSMGTCADCGLQRLFHRDAIVPTPRPGAKS